jgi:hypothetical protein
MVCNSLNNIYSIYIDEFLLVALISIRAFNYNACYSKSKFKVNIHAFNHIHKKNNLYAFSLNNMRRVDVLDNKHNNYNQFYIIFSIVAR